MRHGTWIAKEGQPTVAGVRREGTRAPRFSGGVAPLAAESEPEPESAPEPLEED